MENKEFYKTISFLFFLSFLLLVWKNSFADSSDLPISNLRKLKILSQNQLEIFEQNGFLILHNFINSETCAQLRQSAQQLIQSFDASAIPALYRSCHGEIPWEDYYWKSKNELCFFFEKEAFLPNGEFILSKELAVKKISYSLHDLIPEFAHFSRQPLIIESSRGSWVGKSPAAAINVFD